MEGVKAEPAELHASMSSPVSRISENSSYSHQLDNNGITSPSLWPMPSLLYCNPDFLREVSLVP